MDQPTIYARERVKAAVGASTEELSSALRPHRAPSRILICRPNARLGNTLLLTPLVQEIEAAFPGAELDILTACPSAEEIFREFSCVRTIYRLPYPGACHPLRHLLMLLRASRIRYDLVVDPCPKSWSSRFTMRLLHSRLKLGFISPQKRYGTYLGIPIENASAHTAMYPVQLFRRGMGSLRGDTESAPVPRLSIALTADESSLGRRKLHHLTHAPGSTPILAVATRATGAKQLPISWWRQLLAMVEAELPNLAVIEILAATGEALLPERPGYFSTRIRRLAAVLNAADCFVSADSGLMHLGAATNTTTLGLFKITEPSKYAPYGGLNRAFVVDDEALPRVANEIVHLMRKTRAFKYAKDGRARCDHASSPTVRLQPDADETDAAGL